MSHDKLIDMEEVESGELEKLRRMVRTPTKLGEPDTNPKVMYRAGGGDHVLVRKISDIGWSVTHFKGDSIESLGDGMNAQDAYRLAVKRVTEVLDDE